MAFVTSSNVGASEDTSGSGAAPKAALFTRVVYILHDAKQ